MSEKIVTPGSAKIVGLDGKPTAPVVDNDLATNMLTALEKMVEGLKSGEMRMPNSFVILPFFETEAQLIYLGEPVPTDIIYARLSKFVLRMGLQ